MDDNKNKLKNKLDSPVKEECDSSIKKKLVYPEKETHEEKINKVELWFYISLVFIPFILVCVLIISSILEYSRWPIYTETNITPQNEANFPAMTFCPAHSGYKEHILKVILHLTLLFQNLHKYNSPLKTFSVG